MVPDGASILFLNCSKFVALEDSAVVEILLEIVIPEVGARIDSFSIRKIVVKILQNKLRLIDAIVLLFAGGLDGGITIVQDTEDIWIIECIGIGTSVPSRSCMN